MSVVLFISIMFVFIDVFFLFKQKTAYEMRISDWSSDVCSSDLAPRESPGWPWEGRRMAEHRPDRWTPAGCPLRRQGRRSGRRSSHRPPLPKRWLCGTCLYLPNSCRPGSVRVKVASPLLSQIGRAHV